MSIRPQSSATRSAVDISGLWSVAFDPEDSGEAAGWACGLPDDAAMAIAVPGSWNEQLAEAGYMDYVGTAWVETAIALPPLAPGRERVLRFASADYQARVYLDGAFAGESGAAMLPFEIALGERSGTLRIVVAVSNLLPEQGPTQRVSRADYAAQGRPRDEYWPAVRFDFFPFGGINRPVHVVERPANGISGYRLSCAIAPEPQLRCAIMVGGGARVRLSVSGHGEAWNAEAEVGAGQAEVMLPMPGARLWAPGAPHLYRVDLALFAADGALIDAVGQDYGLREVRVDGTALLLNGVPVELRGFGKHEDSPIHGRGLNLPQLIRDFQLLKWCGANSVRTSHYPYAEEFYDLADRSGILVIDEVFSVNLDFRTVDATTLAAHKAAVTALIERDANRTCVIAWSLANEPGYLGEAEYRTRSAPYWRDLFGHARALDPTRPMTHANVQYAGIDDPAFAESDIVTINRYFGWYGEPAQLERAAARLTAELDTLSAHGKPIFVAEFGADAMAGEHSVSDQLFTEEYQARFIRAYWQVIASHPACIGGHVWNFADFRTAQHGRRVVHNRKGVFTRTREPKLAAFATRELWTGKSVWDRTA
jgi:beta-glucuronidase